MIGEENPVGDDLLARGRTIGGLGAQIAVEFGRTGCLSKRHQQELIIIHYPPKTTKTLFPHPFPQSDN